MKFTPHTDGLGSSARASAPAAAVVGLAVFDRRRPCASSSHNYYIGIWYYYIGPCAHARPFSREWAVTSRGTCAAARALPGGGGSSIGICLHRSRRFRGHGQQRSTTASRFPLYSRRRRCRRLKRHVKYFMAACVGSPLTISLDRRTVSREGYYYPTTATSSLGHSFSTTLESGSIGSSLTFSFPFILLFVIFYLILFSPLAIIIYFNDESNSRIK